jgi:glucose-1-phosphate cytidylyltransferase
MEMRPMKVVLFCGGFGTRLREHSETIPKPMVCIGARPMVWHLMKYYAHFGHREFILCLGYRGDLIKQYFLNYDECLSNDFVFSRGGRDVQLFNRDIDDWKITFADTGLQSNIAERLKAVEHYLDGDEMFLANYTDGLSDLHLPSYIENFRRQEAIAGFVSVQPNYTFHMVSFGEGNVVAGIRGMKKSDVWINGGFFILRREIFDYIQPGDELAEETFQRLVGKQALVSQKHDGFWACMDTLKDKKMFDDMAARGDTPWAVWHNGHAASPRLAAPPR